MAKRIGLVLSGCGAKDGSEIHESVIALLAIDRGGATPMFMAPNINQTSVINHLNGELSEGEQRNILVESARIARGNIVDLKNVHATDFEALILPGGFGAASNLSDFGIKGENCHVQPEVARIMRETLKAKKPIGVICIAPSIMAKMAQEAGIKIKLTIGNDPGTATKLKLMGIEHVECPVTEIVIDREHKIVSTPAYMLANRISETAEGIEKLVSAVIGMA
ncbi:MAG: isoprenoid biosynthesis glyoxalase ElbB [Nitrospirae bacterium]|nr:isoprenoid biosynthesis glyoxalase ElbB [Nitrospirota bacterium]